MKQHEISLKDSNSMRGVAILFIVLHNLIHHIVPVKENEFAYTGSFFQEFMDSLWNGDSFLMNVFSFLGWYGVVIFLFLSGYGLVKKYEGNVQEVSFWVFTKHMYLKLFTLMLIPYLLYILIEYVVHKGSVTYEAFIYHISFLSNLWPQEISPGVYWYLGLIMQLYICYYLFIYKQGIKNLIVLNILSLVVMFICTYYNQQYPVMYYIKHQFLGWILPFTLGILFARYNWSIVFKKNWQNLLAVLVGAILLIWSNSNAYAVLFSSILAIIIAIYLNEVLKNCKYLNKCLIYLGTISAYIFVIHPIVRHHYWSWGHHTFVDISLYAIISIILAIVYKWVYTCLFKKYLTK